MRCSGAMCPASLQWFRISTPHKVSWWVCCVVFCHGATYCLLVDGGLRQYYRSCFLHHNMNTFIETALVFTCWGQLEPLAHTDSDT